MGIAELARNAVHVLPAGALEQRIVMRYAYDMLGNHIHQLGMEAGARWIGHHGMPPPARGTRNTGEQAILVGPEDACGLYIGFVGPP